MAYTPSLRSGEPRTRRAHRVGPPEPVPGPDTVVVIGVSGGLGASSLACAAARHLATEHGTAVLIDADLGGGGLDVTAGVEHLPGPRWGDLGGLAGTVDGPAIEARLPRRGGCAVLSAGYDPAGARAERRPDLGAVCAVVAALPGPKVVDLPRHQVTGDLLALAGHIVVVAACLSRSLADLDALLRVVPLEGAWWVSRGAHADPQVLDDVCDATGLVHLAHLADDPRLPRRAERGEWPDGGALRRVCDRLVGVTAGAAA